MMKDLNERERESSVVHIHTHAHTICPFFEIDR
jgi:hypothetical protein